MAKTKAKAAVKRYVAIDGSVMKLMEDSGGGHFHAIDQVDLREYSYDVAGNILDEWCGVRQRINLTEAYDTLVKYYKNLRKSSTPDAWICTDRRCGILIKFEDAADPDKLTDSICDNCGEGQMKPFKLTPMK